MRYRYANWNVLIHFVIIIGEDIAVRNASERSLYWQSRFNVHSVEEEIEHATKC